MHRKSKCSLQLSSRYLKSYTVHEESSPYFSERQQETIFLMFSAGRCAPGNIAVSPACEGNSTVSWSPVMGADMYIATAMADDGHTHTCSSNYLDSCNFTDLHCGETYAVTVVSVDRGCWSEPSSAVQLRTGERKLERASLCFGVCRLIY